MARDMLFEAAHLSELLSAILKITGKWMLIGMSSNVLKELEKSNKAFVANFPLHVDFVFTN